MRNRSSRARGWVAKWVGSGCLVALGTAAASAEPGVTIDPPVVIAEGADLQAAVAASRATLDDGVTDALVAWSVSPTAIYYRRLGDDLIAPARIAVKGAVGPAWWSVALPRATSC